MRGLPCLHHHVVQPPKSRMEDGNVSSSRRRVPRKRGRFRRECAAQYWYSSIGIFYDRIAGKIAQNCRCSEYSHIRERTHAKRFPESCSVRRVHQVQRGFVCVCRLFTCVVVWATDDTNLHGFRWYCTQVFSYSVHTEKSTH